jgi:tetratricopeptide (TPR) repeat protein
MSLDFQMRGTTMKTISIMLLALLGLRAALDAAEPDKAGADSLALGKSLLQQARELEKEHKYAEALAQAKAAVAALEKAVRAGRQLEWETNNTLLWAAELARRDLLDYQTALQLARRVIALNEGDYWKINAMMNMAETYRGWGEYDLARQQYAAVLELSERDRPRVLLARGKMLYFELDEKQQGQKEILAAVQSEQLHHMQRIRGITDLVEDKRRQREYDAALRLLRMLLELPHLNEKTQSKVAAEAYFKMGEIHREMGQTSDAKTLYRKAMNCEDGDMRYRVRARDALEDILYFE